MNRVQVGAAPSPNLKEIRSKIGSLQNSSYKPGGGHVKIENKKIDIKGTPRIAAKNESYAPKGGDKKVSMYTIIIIVNYVDNRRISLVVYSSLFINSIHVKTNS